MSVLFEFKIETHDSNGTLKLRPVYWLSWTSCPGDAQNQDEIYEQLQAEQVFNI